MNLRKNERIEDLQCNGLKIIQNPDMYTFANDPIILVNFAKIKKGAKVVDLCSGSGVIDILVAGKSRAEVVYGIELQECMAEMSERSVALNNMQEKIKIINAPIQDYAKYLRKAFADVVFCNPPYFKNENLAKKQNEIQKIARHEIKITLEDVVKVASELLNSMGEFYLVHQASRLQEICTLCSKYGISIKELLPIQAKQKNKIHLIVLRGVKGGGEYTEVLNPLVLNNPNGSFTEEVNKLYSKKSL